MQSLLLSDISSTAQPKPNPFCLFVFFDFGVIKPGDVGIKSRDSVIKPMAGGSSNEFLETNYLIARQEEYRPPAAQGDHH